MVTHTSTSSLPRRQKRTARRGASRKGLTCADNARHELAGPGRTTRGVQKQAIDAKINGGNRTDSGTHGTETGAWCQSARMCALGSGEGAACGPWTDGTSPMDKFFHLAAKEADVDRIDRRSTLPLHADVMTHGALRDVGGRGCDRTCGDRRRRSDGAHVGGRVGAGGDRRCHCRAARQP